MNKLTIQGIWTQISAEEWLTFLHEYRPDGQWSQQGTRLHGCCPFHNDTHPSAWLYADRGYFKCYACNKYTTDPLVMYATVAAVSIDEALAGVHARFGLRGLSSKFTEEVQNTLRLRRVRNAIATALNTELIELAAGNVQAPNARAEKTIEWLRSRKVADNYHALPLGVLPTTKRLKELIRDAGVVESCVDYLSKWLTLDFLGSLVFAYHSNPNELCRFRLRLPDTKKIYAIDDPSGENGFFGLGIPSYLSLYNNDAVKYIIAVEGEFDQLAFAVNQLSTGKFEFPVISVGGMEVGCLDSLARLGFDEIRVVSDSPQHSGDIIARNIIKNTAKVPLSVFTWPSSFNAKDPDEAINVRFGYTDSVRVMTDKANYRPPHLWCFNKAVSNLALLDINDIRQRTATIQDWAAILRNDDERAAYVGAIAKDQGLSYTEISKKIISPDDDELQFVARLEAALEDIYVILGEEAAGSTSYLHVWNKRKKLPRKLQLSRASDVEIELSKDVGLLSQWIRDQVGEPAFLAAKTGPEGRNRDLGLLEREALAKSYLGLALRNILSRATNYKFLTPKGQGIHFLPQDGEARAVVVNGKDSYVVTYFDADVQCKAIDSPVCDNYYLELDDKFKWSESISSAEDILRGKTVDILDLHSKLLDILSSGWSFSSNLEAEFLAAQTLAIPVSSALRRQTYIFVTAEASSGKSRLTLGYFGGTQFPAINVLEHSVGMDDYTEAGFRQDSNNNTLMCCLDEFEDDASSSAKAIEVRKILKVLRNIMGASNRIVKGSPGGETKIYNLRFPVMMSAISTMREPADISRMITINMRTDRARVDPVVAVSEKYHTVDIEQIRADVSVALLTRLPELLRNYAIVEKEFARGAGLPKGTQTRFIEGMYPALAVMRTLGLDYHTFASRFCVLKQSYLSKMATATENDDILSAVLNSPHVTARIEGRISSTASVSELLTRPDTRELLNTTGCGVYYHDNSSALDTEHWLIVNWVQAIQGVLSHHPKYRGETSPTHIKEMADRNEHIISQDKVRRSGIIRRVVGSSAKLSDVTVYDVTNYVSDVAPDTTQLESFNL